MHQPTTPTLGFIFDLDGTIVDSTAYYRETWEELIREYGIDADPEQFLQQATRVSIQTLLGESATDEQLEEHAALHAERGNQKMRARGVQAHNGMLDLIAGLKARGVKIALATAAERSNAEWTLDELSIHDAFDAIVVDRDVAHGKPAPDIYLKALHQLGVSSDHCAVMEDSATGVSAAKAAGLRVLAVLTTHSRRDLEQAGADKIVARASDLTVDDLISFITKPIPNS